MSQLISASDFATLLACDRRVYLNHHGDPVLRLAPSAYDEWLMQRGQAFEKQITSGLDFVTPLYLPTDLQQGFRLTLDFMRNGVPLIYQGVLLADDLVGIPDLLERVEGASALGSYHYQPLDIKLASEARPEHRLQMMAYIALLEAIQGVRPRGRLILRLPPAERGGERLYHEETVIFDEALFAEKLAELRALAAGDEPQPFISSECASCPWRGVCLPLAEQNRDASLIPGLRREVWKSLHARGLGSLPALAAASAEEIVSIRGMGEKSAMQIIQQARALTEQRLIPLAPPRLPPPADGEVFFDVESVPLEGFTYLLGTLVRRGGDYHYECDVARSPQDEGVMWQGFLRRMDGHQGAIYHYGAFERTTINGLMARYGVDARAQALLGRMVDISKVLKASAVLPLRGYSLKDVAPWLGFTWSEEMQSAGDSMVEYIRWLETGDEQHLERILHYNEEDLRATLMVRNWLLALAGSTEEGSSSCTER